TAKIIAHYYVLLTKTIIYETSFDSSAYFCLITFCNPNGEHFEYLREYDGYLIRDNGTIKFVNNFYQPLLVTSDSNFSYYYRLNDGMSNVQVEAGEFECADMVYYVTNADDIQLPGSNNYLYADGIGLKYDTTSFVSQDIHTI